LQIVFKEGAMSASDNILKDEDRSDIDRRLIDYHLVEQDPVKVAPKTYKVLLENDRVRVLEVRLKPGRGSPLHSHPAYIIYALSTCKVRLTLPNGKTKEVRMRSGEATWSDAESHAVDNIGSTEVHVLNIELKGTQKK
jgi:quercetin dioxygenase-like cupin family protein